MGLEGANLAATGFQKKDYDKNEIALMFKKFYHTTKKSWVYSLISKVG